MGRGSKPRSWCASPSTTTAHRVVKVVIGEEAEDIRLARDAEGQPLVYDEQRTSAPTPGPSSRTTVPDLDGPGAGSLMIQIRHLGGWS
jgi:hypothetical protein